MKLLFITWDGPQVHYMEGLFFPIFEKIKEKFPVDFHIIQFTWDNHNRVRKTRKKAGELGFSYRAEKVYQNPHSVAGTLATILKGRYGIKEYIQENDIDVVMPRSTMPAIMVNSIKHKFNDIKVIFDADGFPIEERVDFRGLKTNSLQYKILKWQEHKMLNEADCVLTRSEKAVNIHKKNIDTAKGDKFYIVKNGRDPGLFSIDKRLRKEVRNKLSVSEDATLFVYCGSLGAKYDVEEMLKIFETARKKRKETVFLILTGSTEYLQGKVPEHLKDGIIVKTAPFQEVPAYLNAADIAFSIIKPFYSMQAVSPVKLGEYLLMGLPTIASEGIGDTKKILQEVPNCFLFTHDENSVAKAADWAINLGRVDRENIRYFGVEHFSLEQSAISYIQALKDLN